MAVAYTRGRDWSKEDITFIRENYGRMTRHQLKQHFKVTRIAIDSVIRKHTITLPRRHKIKIKATSTKGMRKVCIPEIRAEVWVSPEKTDAQVREKYLNRNKY